MRRLPLLLLGSVIVSMLFAQAINAQVTNEKMLQLNAVNPALLSGLNAPDGTETGLEIINVFRYPLELSLKADEKRVVEFMLVPSDKRYLFDYIDHENYKSLAASVRIPEEKFMTYLARDLDQQLKIVLPQIRANVRFKQFVSGAIGVVEVYGKTTKNSFLANLSKFATVAEFLHELYDAERLDDVEVLKYVQKAYSSLGLDIYSSMFLTPEAKKNFDIGVTALMAVIDMAKGVDDRQVQKEVQKFVERRIRTDLQILKIVNRSGRLPISHDINDPHLLFHKTPRVILSFDPAFAGGGAEDGLWSAESNYAYAFGGRALLYRSFKHRGVFVAGVRGFYETYPELISGDISLKADAIGGGIFAGFRAYNSTIISQYGSIGIGASYFDFQTTSVSTNSDIELVNPLSFYIELDGGFHISGPVFLTMGIKIVPLPWVEYEIEDDSNPEIPGTIGRLHIGIGLGF